MPLYKRLQDEMAGALRSGDAVRLSVLRMVISSAKTLQIDKALKTLDDPDILQIIQKQAKQRRESIEQFKKGNRQDLADKEAAELVILESYMPKQLGSEELTALVKEAIAATGAISRADIGKVMKFVMEKARGRADGKAINAVVAGLIK